MRRILVENARRRRAKKRGGGAQKVSLDEIEPAINPADDDLLALDESLAALEAKNKLMADVVKLRFFAGLTVSETAAALAVSTSTVDNYWAYARAWLRIQLVADDDSRSE